MRPGAHQFYRRLIAAALTSALLSAALVGCSKPAKFHGQIPLLPAAVSQGNNWGWSSACPIGPHSSSGCAPAGPHLGAAQLAGNEWNLGSSPGATGEVNMAVNSTGGLSLRGDLTNAPPCTASTCLTNQANTWVRGYPSVLYGIDQCHAATSPPSSPKLQLPMAVNAIPADLVGRATYNAQAAQVTYNVAYDLWLSPSATTTPCQTDGTLEVMVWTDYSAKAPLPDSLIIGTATIPYAVDGVVKPGVQSWTVYANNVYGGGHTVPWGGTVWLIPNAAAVTERGTVSVDLSAALGEVSTVLQHVYGWAPIGSSHWLDTIAFGMEYGPASADPYGAGPTNFALDLSAYCLLVGTTLAGTTC